MKDILRLFLTRAIYFALLIISTSVIGIGFPYVPKHATLVMLFSVGIPTLALASWARPGNVPRRSIIRTILRFVIPASFSVFLFGLIIYVTTYGIAYAEVEANSINLSQAEIDRFRISAGIDYPIETGEEYYKELSTLVAQNSLTTFTLLAGLMLIIFVEPPIPFLEGGDELSSDKRPTILAMALLLCFALIVVVQPLRNFFELLVLPTRWYAIIAGMVLLWMFLLRQAWKGNWYERFLHLDPEGYRLRGID
jgi:cation-transporting ATPase E